MTTESGPEPAAIEVAFLSACRAELASLKPGNVHVYGDGHRMDVAMFEASAVAAAPHIAARGTRVGRRIEQAVEASVAVAGCNTNLGIVLLCAPLAAAAERAGAPLRVALDFVLDELDVVDAEAAYRAIGNARPAGLGEVAQADVAAPPQVTLLQAMVLARGRDRIANAYATDFAEVFDFSLPALATARLSAATEELAITSLHMNLLSQFADSHIARKFGTAVAHQVQREAHRLETSYHPAASDTTLPALLDFDAGLKSRGLNPGTTADFVVTTLFAANLMQNNRGGA